MRRIYLIIILIWAHHTCEGQQINADNNDIVIVDDTVTTTFKDVLYETVSHFICQDSVNRNMFYVHYEPWASAVKTESILQVCYENRQLYVVGILMRINMSEDVEKCGESPIFFMSGKEDVIDFILPISGIEKFKWLNHYEKINNMLNCFVLNNRAEIIQKRYISKKLPFDYKLLIDIKNTPLSDNKGVYMNGKLTAATMTLGNVFNPPGFAVCKKSWTPRPCTPMVTKWSGFYDGMTVNGNSNPLTDSSKGTCAMGRSKKGCHIMPEPNTTHTARRYDYSFFA